MRLESSPDEGGWVHDVVCDHCGERSRLHPHEGLVSQLLVFRTQHRHDDHGRGEGDVQRATPRT